MAAFCGLLRAQTEKTITLRMLDSKTGRLIATSDFLVRTDHQQTIHANWVALNEDGTGKLIVPKDVTVLAIQGTYNSSMDIYVNCDSATQRDYPVDRWYPVSGILTSGVVAPNGCGKPAAVAKFKPIAKPGEFIFFVRKPNLREQMQDFK
jgi:carbohydrate-selective porin OprB